MKKLNNKGFTLIELLAVIVILALLMVVASGSIITVMNNSRKSGFLSSAQSAATALNDAYADALVSNQTYIYGVSISNLISNTGYVIGASDTQLLDGLGINTSDYSLKSGGGAVGTSTAASTSMIAFNQQTSKFVVCFVAKSASSFYVSGAGTSSNKDISSSFTIKTLVTTTSATGERGYATSSIKLTVPQNDMYACSNGAKSW